MAMAANVKNDEHQFILEVIKMYRDLPILWKVNSPEYSNRLKKTEAYNILINKFNERYPGANRETVVKKINSLRTNYRKVRKKIVLSKIFGNEKADVRLWYYDEMKFLDEQVEHSCELPSSTKPDVEVPIVIKYELPDSLFEVDECVVEPQASKPPATIMTKRKHSKSTETSNRNKKSCIVHTDADNSHSSINATKFHDDSKRAKLPTHSENNIRPFLNSSSIYSSNTQHDQCDSSKTKQLVSTTNANIISECNEFEYLAKLWASDLQRMEPEQRLFAKKAISDVLFEGRLGNLDRNTVQISTNK